MAAFGTQTFRTYVCVRTNAGIVLSRQTRRVCETEVISYRYCATTRIASQAMTATTGIKSSHAISIRRLRTATPAPSRSTGIVKPIQPTLGVPPRYRESGAIMTAEATSVVGRLFMMPTADSTTAITTAGQPNTAAGHQFTDQSPCSMGHGCYRTNNPIDLCGVAILRFRITLISDKDQGSSINKPPLPVE